VDLGKSLISRYVAPDEFKPSTIEHWLSMKEMELKWFTALNNAGGTNSSYEWVEAIVRLQRPLVAAIALGTWAFSHTYGTPSSEIDNFAAVIGFYLFGDRTLFYTKKALAK
jgi:hypothetical protein